MVAGKIERFEDLIAWQKARVLAREVFMMTGKGAFRRDFSLTDQMRRAARSIGANIAEGFERVGPREFHRALSTSKASCAELRSDLYTALDITYIDEAEFEHMQALAIEVARIIGALRAAVERRIAADEQLSKR